MCGRAAKNLCEFITMASIRIIALGDPHGSEKIRQICFSEADLVLTPGDIGEADKLRKYYFDYFFKGEKTLSEEKLKEAYKESVNSMEKVLVYLSKNVRHMFVVTGNADAFAELGEEYALSLPTLSEICNGLTNVELIDYKCASYQGINVAGLPFHFSPHLAETFLSQKIPAQETVTRKREEANRGENKAKDFLHSIEGQQVDILLSHNPPFCGEYKGRSLDLPLDVIRFPLAPEHLQGKHAGSLVLTEYLLSTLNPPKLVVCGHIHEGKGRYRLDRTEIINCGANGQFVEFECRSDC